MPKRQPQPRPSPSAVLVLVDFTKPDEGTGEPSRALQALQSAGDSASGLGEAAWDKTSGARSAIRDAAIGGAGVVRSKLKQNR